MQTCKSNPKPAPGNQRRSIRPGSILNKRLLHVANRRQPRKIDLSWTLRGPDQAHVAGFIDRELLLEGLVRRRKVDRRRERGAAIVRTLIGRVGWRFRAKHGHIAAGIYRERGWPSGERNPERRRVRVERCARILRIGKHRAARRCPQHIDSAVWSRDHFVYRRARWRRNLNGRRKICSTVGGPREVQRRAVGDPRNIQITGGIHESCGLRVACARAARDCLGRGVSASVGGSTKRDRAICYRRRGRPENVDLAGWSRLPPVRPPHLEQRPQWLPALKMWCRWSKTSPKHSTSHRST